MTAENSRFAQLMRGIQEGSEEARRELIDEYGSHILRIVRRRLHHQLRRQYDSIDFQQAVWGSFFHISRERLNFQSPKELSRYLATMTIHKLTDAFRNRLRTQKNNLNREKSFDDIEAKYARSDRRQATPSQFALADEVWQKMMTECDRAKDARFRQVFAMLRDGHSYAEISAQTGIHLKMIQRLVRKVRERLPQ